MRLTSCYETTLKHDKNTNTYYYSWRTKQTDLSVADKSVSSKE